MAPNAALLPTSGVLEDRDLVQANGAHARETETSHGLLLRGWTLEKLRCNRIVGR